MTLSVKRLVTSEIVPVAQVTPLGTARGQDYVEIADREYLLERNAMRDRGDVSEREGQVFVSIPEIATDDRGKSMAVGALYRRALPVPTGTYATAIEQAADRKAAKPSRPADALDLPALAPKLSWIAPQPAVENSDRTPFIGLAATVPGLKGGLAPGRRAIRGRAILDRLAEKGITLRTHAGRLLVGAPNGRLTTDLRDVVDKAERLLIGFVSGHPLSCELPHTGAAPEAWTILVGGLAACEEHATTGGLPE